MGGKTKKVGVGGQGASGKAQGPRRKILRRRRHVEKEKNPEGECQMKGRRMAVAGERGVGASKV